MAQTPAVTKASTVVPPPKPKTEVAAPTMPVRPAFEPLQLVPSDTVAVVRIASMEALEDTILKVSAIAERTGQPVQLREDLMALAALAGVDWQKVRKSEPLIFAARWPKAATEPTIVAYAPLPGAINEPGQVARQTAMDGGYVALTLDNSPAPNAAPPAWCESMAAEASSELVRAHVDVRSLMRRFGPSLPVWLGSLTPSEGLTPEQKEEFALRDAALMEALKTCLALDVAVNVDSGKLALRSEIQLEEGPIAAQASERGNNLNALVRHLSADTPLVGAIAFDTAHQAIDQGVIGGAMEWMAPLQAVVDAVEGALPEFLGSFEPGAVTLIDPTPGAMHLAIVLQARDTSIAGTALGRLLGSIDFETVGLDLSLPVRSRLGNAVVEDFTIRLDGRRLDFDARSQMRELFEAFLGGPHIHLYMATSGREMMLVLGGANSGTEARLRAFTAPKGAPPELQAAVEALGNANPGQVWRVDAARLVTLGAEFAAAAVGGSPAAARRDALRAAPSLGSVPVLLWGGVRTDRAFGGCEVNLDDLERAFRVLGTR